MGMGVPAGLDPDLLRAFVLIAEEGSFTRAARLRRAHAIGGVDAGAAAGGTARPDPAGARARRRGAADRRRGSGCSARRASCWRCTTASGAASAAPTVQGTVRLGTPDDYALRYLPQILARFAAAHPAVDVEVLCLPSEDLVPRLEGRRPGSVAGVAKRQAPLRLAGAVRLLRGPLAWITSETHGAHRRDPLPLALGNTRPSTPRSATGCVWARSALAALEAAGLRYRVAYRSATQTGTLAPALAGLAVAVGPASWLPPGLRALGPARACRRCPSSASCC